MRPIVSYYGGKQRLASRIVELIPKHTVYVEPFCGGASVFFKKPWPNVSNTHHYREVLNDRCGELVNLYRVFQDKSKAEELIHRLQFTLYSRSEYARRKQTGGSDIDRAWRYYVDLKMSFSNKKGAGWGTGVYTVNHAATWANKVAGLNEYLERMAAVYIENDEAINVIQRWDSPQTFFYCDPPYPGTGQGHYSGYSLDDFRRLWDAISQAQGSFMLSCYDVGFDTPEGWEKIEMKAHCSSRGRVGYDRSKKQDESAQNRQRTEIIYRRVNQAPVREEIQKLYQMGLFDCFGSD